jgi:transcriptional regulator with XRE-family HTH domain
MDQKLIKSKIFLRYGTQGDFALAVGMDETLVSKIIRGRRELDSERQVIWADALKSTPRELFGKEESV